MRLIVFILILLVLGCSKMNSNKKTIVFGTVQIPFSSDPMKFDYMTHHYAFNSVYGKLVSLEKNGEIHPQISNFWKNSEDFKKWTFKIQSGLRFSNGDTITPQIVLLSLKRIAFLMHKNNSKSGLMEYLLGLETFKNISDDLKGLYIEDGQVVFEFVKPIPNLLQLVSFGLYSIVHPDTFDHKTGDWKEPLKAISSSNYEVKTWTEADYVLKLREEFQSNSNLIREVKFTLIKNIADSNDLSKVDLLVGDKSSLMVDSNFSFIGSTVNLKIGYAVVQSWKNEKSPLSKVSIRRWFRKVFYEDLSKSGLTITNSFLPPHLTGVNSISGDYKVEKPMFEKFNITTHPITISGKIKENSNKKSIAEIFLSGLKSLGSPESGAEVLFKDYPKDSMLDISISGTGIESDDYLETLRFMFLSKEGIDLPDSTGVIKKELLKTSPDVNIINKEIWDQAIVWPIRHYSSGYWFNNKSELDYSDLNIDSAAIDFQFLKWK